MRWIKHPSNFSRSAAMSEVREKCGAAGYGAVWMILERIAENFDASELKIEPELCISEKEWRLSCGLSATKLQDLLEILQNHSVIFSENGNSRLRLTAPILLQLQDESTRKARKNSGVAPEPCRSDSGLQQTTTEQKRIEKNRTDNREKSVVLHSVLTPVLKRHGLLSNPERVKRIVRHIERKSPRNPCGYLESILKEKPYFDPPEEPTEERAEEYPASGDNRQADRQQGPMAVGEVLQNMGFTPPRENSRGDA